MEAARANPMTDQLPRTLAAVSSRGFAGETHVKIRHGRNYQDVAPIRGVYRGPAAEELEVAVRMSRVNGNG